MWKSYLNTRPSLRLFLQLKSLRVFWYIWLSRIFILHVSTVEKKCTNLIKNSIGKLARWYSSSLYFSKYVCTLLQKIANIILLIHNNDNIIILPSIVWQRIHSFLHDIGNVDLSQFRNIGSTIDPSQIWKKNLTIYFLEFWLKPWLKLTVYVLFSICRVELDVVFFFRPIICVLCINWVTAAKEVCWQKYGHKTL